MGILDSIQSLAGQVGGAAQGDQAKVAGGFIEALSSHPGGLQGILESLKSNGLGDHVGAWATGQAQQATPDQIQQGLGPTGLIEKTAEKAGVSSTVVTAALAAVLPMVIQHFTANTNGEPASGEPASSGNLGGLAQQVLGKLL